MDPLSNFGAWLGNRIAAELEFAAKMVPLKIQTAWVDLQLAWVDLKLAWYLR
jgi:hypothetical protein